MSSSIARLAVNTCRIMAEVAMIRALECDQPYQFKDSSAPLLTPDKEIAADNIKDGIITRWDVTITAEDFHAVLELVTSALSSCHTYLVFSSFHRGQT